MRGLTGIGRGTAWTTLTAVALLVGVVGSAEGQIMPIDELQAIGPDATVELEVVTHSLVIEGWDRNEIQIVGEYDSDFETFETRGGGQSFRLTIEDVDDDRRSRSRESSRLEVRVPRGVRLSTRTISGSVEVRGLRGTVNATAISGSVDATGDMESVSLESTSGSVSYSGDSPSVRMESISGDIDFSGSTQSARMESVSGSVRMDGQAEMVEASSVSGRIDVNSTVAVRSLEATSVSGRVSYTGGLAEGGTIDVESHSGAVDLTLGSDVDARFDLSTFSGGITSNLTGAHDENRSQSRFTPNQSLSFATGAGSGRVRATSFSGSVTVRERGE